jgi:hypothetical protein
LGGRLQGFYKDTGAESVGYIGGGLGGF